MAIRSEVTTSFFIDNKGCIEDAMHSRAYQVTKRVVEAAKELNLPTVLTLAPKEGEISLAPRIPLVGGGEMRFWRRLLGDEPYVIVEMNIESHAGGDSPTGTKLNMEGDLLQLGVNNEFVIPETRGKVGLKYLANMDPIRDIDWDKLKPESVEWRIAMAMASKI